MVNEKDDKQCSADSRLDEQLTAQLEGLAIGLDQRGEKSAAHIIRTALKRFTLTEPQAVPVTHAMVPSWDEEAALQKIAFRDIKIQNLEKALTEVANRTYSSDRRCRLKYDAVAAIYDIASAALRGEGMRPSPLTRPK